MSFGIKCLCAAAIKPPHYARKTPTFPNKRDADTDEPEGARYIQISETLAQHMAATIEAYEGTGCCELYEAASKMKATHDVFAGLPTITPEDANIKRQAHMHYEKRVYRLAYKVMQHFAAFQVNVVA